MMSVKDYALDVGRSVKEILDKCNTLGFSASNEDDILSEDEVIDLDNAVYEDNEEENLIDKAEEIVSNMKNVDDTVHVQKLKKKSDIISANDFKKEKKEMYKHKEKLMSNAPVKEDNKIVYEENMTLSKLAEKLNANPIDLIKKFMTLGVMANLNSVVSYDDAELVVMDYDKELKKAVRFYPHIAKGEGQFAVILKKKGNLKPNEFNFKTNDLIDNYIKNDVSIKLNAKMFHNCFYNSLDINLDGLKIISNGVDLGEVKNNRFIYHHYFVTAYGKYFQNKLDLDLNDPRLIMYLKGYEITDETVNNGYGVICVCGYPLGLFKASNGILKNHYPKGLRING